MDFSHETFRGILAPEDGLDDSSPYFHHSQKCGFQLHLAPEERDTSGHFNYLKRSHCTTHNIRTCFCGWEVGWHGGEYNRELNPKKPRRSDPFT